MVPVPALPVAAQAVSAAGNRGAVLILSIGISSLLLISVVFAAHNGSGAPYLLPILPDISQKVKQPAVAPAQLWVTPVSCLVYIAVASGCAL